MFISEEVIFTLPGTNVVNITAFIYVSSINSLTVEWYHRSSFINAANNPRYSITTILGDNLNRQVVLSIRNVDTDVLGSYVVLISVDGRNDIDDVPLLFKGTGIYN